MCGHGFHRNCAGDMSGRLSAHAVRDHEKSQFAEHAVTVFVSCSHAADVAASTDIDMQKSTPGLRYPSRHAFHCPSNRQTKTRIYNRSHGYLSQTSMGYTPFKDYKRC